MRLFFGLLLLLLSLPASAQGLSLRLDKHPQGVRLWLQTAARASFSMYRLSAPARLILEGSHSRTFVAQKRGTLEVQHGPLLKIELSTSRKGQRLIFFLETSQLKDVELTYRRTPQGRPLLVSFVARAPVAMPVARAPVAPRPRLRPRPRVPRTPWLALWKRAHSSPPPSPLRPDGDLQVLAASERKALATLQSKGRAWSLAKLAPFARRDATIMPLNQQPIYRQERRLAEAQQTARALFRFWTDDLERVPKAPRLTTPRFARPTIPRPPNTSQDTDAEGKLWAAHRSQMLAKARREHQAHDARQSQRNAHLSQRLFGPRAAANSTSRDARWVRWQAAFKSSPPPAPRPLPRRLQNKSTDALARDRSARREEAAALAQLERSRRDAHRSFSGTLKAQLLQIGLQQERALAKANEVLARAMALYAGVLGKKAHRDSQQFRGLWKAPPAKTQRLAVARRLPRRPTLRRQPIAPRQPRRVARVSPKLRPAPRQVAPAPRTSAPRTSAPRTSAPRTSGPPPTLMDVFRRLVPLATDRKRRSPSKSGQPHRFIRARLAQGYQWDRLLLTLESPPNSRLQTRHKRIHARLLKITLLNTVARKVHTVDASIFFSNVRSVRIKSTASRTVELWITLRNPSRFKLQRAASRLTLSFPRFARRDR